MHCEYGGLFKNKLIGFPSPTLAGSCGNLFVQTILELDLENVGG